MLSGADGAAAHQHAAELLRPPSCSQRASGSRGDSQGDAGAVTMIATTGTTMPIPAVRSSDAPG